MPEQQVAPAPDVVAANKQRLAEARQHQKDLAAQREEETARRVRADKDVLAKIRKYMAAQRDDAIANGGDPDEASRAEEPVQRLPGSEKLYAGQDVTYVDGTGRQHPAYIERIRLHEIAVAKGENKEAPAAIEIADVVVFYTNVRSHHPDREGPVTIRGLTCRHDAGDGKGYFVPEVCKISGKKE